MKRLLFVLAVLGVFAVVPVAAHANIVTGSLWENHGVDATVANIPVTTPDVTFSVNSPLNFDSRAAGSGYTIGTWLGGGGATILTGAGKAGDTMNNTFYLFTGTVTVTNGESFTVTHDDGLTLIINGLTVVNVPGPTAPAVTTATYTGASGNVPFELVYSEVDGAPAVLQVDLPLTSAVPEPSTLIVWSLLGTLAIGLGWWRKRKAA